MGIIIEEIAKEIPSLLITVISGAIIALSRIVFKCLIDWINKKDEVIRFNAFLDTYMKYVLLYYMFVLVGSVLFPFIIIYGFALIYDMVGINSDYHIELLFYIHKALVIIINFYGTFILAYKLGVMNTLSSRLEKKRLLYYSLVINYPVIGCLYVTTITRQYVFDSISKVCLVLLVVNLIIGVKIFSKPKRYQLYKKVIIVFKCGKRIVCKYKQIELNHDYITITWNKGKEDHKVVTYNKDTIECLEYVVDTNIDNNYKEYLLNNF